MTCPIGSRTSWLTHGTPEHIRSDDGSEFTALAVRQWLENTGVRILYIEPGSPWEDGYCERFNGQFRDEPLDQEIFYTLRKARHYSSNGDARNTTPSDITAH